MSIRRRSVYDADRPFLLELYASTREAEMAMVPWTAQQKRAFVEMQFAGQLEGYRETYPNAVHEIILAEDRPAGRIWVDQGESGIHILDVTIAPACRSMGFGSAVMREILSEGDQTGKAVTIYVEDFNRSRGLFERLGFRVAEQDGFQLLLKRLPGSPEEESNSPAGAAPASD